ncbi:MAG: FhaA domain-containing protein [Solirubrobacteraceae bacterium]
MNLLKSVETTIAKLVEGAFGRAFRSEVRPIELARKLAREMDAHRTVSVSRVYAPNEFTVFLSTEDRQRYEGVEHEVIDELSAYLLEHARSENLILSSSPQITFETDERLALGEFGIQARLVRHDQEADRGGPAQPDDGGGGHGQTMIYSTSARVGGPVEEAQGRRASRALLAVDGRRLLLPATGGTVGRSRNCDVVLEDTGVSRRHAELRPGPEGWMIEDLGSTNGVLVNGIQIAGPHPVDSGDRIELGSTVAIFESS